MSITCDICNSELQVAAGGEYAVCCKCGMKHSIDRVREKLSGAEKCEAIAVTKTAVPSVVADDEVYDAEYVVQESAYMYTAPLPEDELAVLEGRVGDYILRKDPRSAIELQQVFSEYFQSSIFDEYTVEEYVPASFFGAHSLCMPINFLFKKRGVPELAVAILRSPSRSHGSVTGTIEACRRNGIKYVDFQVGMPNTKFYVMRKVIEKLGIN